MFDGTNLILISEAYHNLSRLKFKHKSSIDIRQSNYRDLFINLKDLIVDLQHTCLKQIHLLTLLIEIDGYNVLLNTFAKCDFSDT